MFTNFKIIKKHKHKFRLSSESGAGFTIIELAVVMAVFLFVIGAAIGIFLSIIQNQKKVLAEQQFLNQISYVEEYMSKALRMAAVDTSGSLCLGPSNAGYIYLLTRHHDISGPYAGFFRGIKFFNQSIPACQEFFLDNTDPAHPVLKELKDSTNDSNAVALTSSAMQINSIRFSINGLDGSVAGQGCAGSPNQCGALSTDTVQPRVTILLNISIPGEPATRTIQTTVSQRNLNAK